MLAVCIIFLSFFLSAAKIQMATRKYTHNTEIECTPPPVILSYYLLSSAGNRGCLVVAKFHSKSTMLSET